jgi:branched-chain amino acid transport system substrate-binding protein
MKRFMIGISMSIVLSTALVAQADITIGVSVSSTGPAAALGIPAKNAFAFAPAVIGGEKVRYVIFDDATDTTNAVQNVKRLINDEKADLLIGPSTVANGVAVVNFVAESKTPMIQLAPGPQSIASNDPKRRWIFNAPASNDVYTSAMVNQMARKGIKTVSIIAVDDSYGEASLKSYTPLAEAKGIKTLTIEKYKRADTSATSQVLHAMAGNPDAVYIISSGTPAVMPHRALVERGYKGKIYQTGGAASFDFLRVGGKAVNGSFLPTSPLMVAEQLPEGYPTKKEALKFIKAYEAKFGPRSTFAASIWDQLLILETAIPKALKHGKPGTEKFREALRTALEETRGVKGSFAVYSTSPTDHTGINELGMCMVRVENGAWKLEEHAKFK